MITSGSVKVLPKFSVTYLYFSVDWAITPYSTYIYPLIKSRSIILLIKANNTDKYTSFNLLFWVTGKPISVYIFVFDKLM
jgi:hypothetical protein